MRKSNKQIRLVDEVSLYSTIPKGTTNPDDIIAPSTAITVTSVVQLSQPSVEQLSQPSVEQLSQPSVEQLSQLFKRQKAPLRLDPHSATVNETRNQL